MYIFDLKVGYSCNNSCTHCVIQINKEMIEKSGESYDRTTEECMCEIDKGYEEFLSSCNQRSMVVITGGEPTIRPDLLNLCDYIVKKGFENIDIQTNGRALSNYDFTKELVEGYPIRFVVALHGNNSDIHDTVTTKNGSFFQTVRGIQNIKKLKGRIIGKIVISKTNSKCLLETIKLYKELEVNHVNIAFPHSSIKDHRFFDFVPRYSDIVEEVSKVIEFAKENDMLVTFECIPLCLMKGNEEYISEFGIKDNDSLTSPVNSKIVDWSKRRLEIKSKAKACKKCYFNDLCEGVWEEYIHYYGEEEFIPVTEVKTFMNVLNKVQTLNKIKKYG